MITALEKECLKTGEFQHSKPKTQAVEWEDGEQFTMSDLARMGVADHAIFEFWRNKTFASPIEKWSATEHQFELAMLGIFDTLVENGFVRRVQPDVKPGDCFDTPGGRVMVALGPNVCGGSAPPRESVVVVYATGSAGFVRKSVLLGDSIPLKPISNTI